MIKMLFVISLSILSLCKFDYKNINIINDYYKYQEKINDENEMNADIDEKIQELISSEKASKKSSKEEYSKHEVEKTTTYDEIKEWIEYFCDEFPNIDPKIIYGIMRKESGFKSDATSYANCMGLGQLHPKYQWKRIEYLSSKGYFEYHEEWTIEDYLYDPYINTCITCYYWSELLKTYDFDTACKVYNLGAGNLGNEYLERRCETIYIAKVYEYMKQYENKYGVINDGLISPSERIIEETVIEEYVVNEIIEGTENE